MKILLRLPLPMTKEEKKAKGKEEEEVPEGFIDAVNEFYKSSDIIFKCFDDKVKAGGKLSNDDLNQLIEIDRFAEEHNLSELHEKVAKIIVSIEKTIPAEEVELKEGEIKELDEDTLVRKRKNGVIELIIL